MFSSAWYFGSEVSCKTAVLRSEVVGSNLAMGISCTNCSSLGFHRCLSVNAAVVF